jgi:hypothetical protein
MREQDFVSTSDELEDYVIDLQCLQIGLACRINECCGGEDVQY